MCACVFGLVAELVAGRGQGRFPVGFCRGWWEVPEQMLPIGSDLPYFKARKVN